MHPVTRIEIFVAAFELGKIVEGLEQAGVPGYSVIRNVAGKGASGKVSEDLAMTNLDNAYVLVFCPAELVQPTIDQIRPLLNKFGGACFVSDALEVRSMHCVTAL